MKKSFILLISLFVIISSNAQVVDPKIILQKVQAKMELVKDYKSDITIRLNLEMVKIPAKKAVMYYKRPDKIHFETKGFALIPKKASNFQQTDVLAGNYTAIFVKYELFEGKKLTVIKVVPMDESSEVVLSTLWIDEEKNQIRKIESVTRNEGSVNMQLVYGNMPFDLPQSILVTFEVAQMDLPMGISGDFESGMDIPSEEKTDKSKKSKGSVWITYENYVVNAGIDDVVFRRRKNKYNKVFSNRLCYILF